jgi:putrescine transport system ATP-binding protein
LKYALQVNGLGVTYGSHEILKSVSFHLRAGQTLVVLGESGCGKTTLLRAVAGLAPIFEGDVALNGRVISHLAPRDRGVIYLDQEPLLFEHLTVAENIAFAMRLRRQPEDVIQTSVRQMLDAIDLRDHANKRDWQLSGGQKQRVAFARAVLATPQLMLLDEPFCSLDGRTRSQMQSLFAEISQRFSLTSIFVTHDVKEALIAGNQFARMSEGRLLLYPDRNAFLRDEATGIPEEIAFWRTQSEIEHQQAAKDA